jgi:amino acid permease
MKISSLDSFFKVYSNYLTFPLIIFVKLLFDFFKKLNKFDENNDNENNDNENNDNENSDNSDNENSDNDLKKIE